MKDPVLHKKFIFNDNIDSSFLFSLYEDDFQYMEEIFKTTLDQLDQEIPGISTAFNDKDITGLQKIVHKIKPAFGFTGFLSTELACKEFEDACIEVSRIDELAPLFHSLWTLLLKSIDIMHQQYDLLKEFNNQ